MLFVVSFIGTILVGTVLLSLPVASRSQPLPIIDALFQSASAVCITGLTTITVGTDLSVFGQIVLLVLFQVGALGIMTYSLALVGFVQRQGSPEQTEWLANVFTKDRKLPPERMVGWIVKSTLVVEGLGIAALFCVMLFHFEPLTALYHAVFHGVSAFCNAGFSLYSASLTGYQGSVSVNLIVCILVVIGASGFVVTFEVWRSLTGQRRWFKLLAQTKIILYTTVLLFLGGLACFVLFEVNHIHAGMPLKNRILTSFFQAMASRTAGFSTIDFSALTNPSLLLFILLMLIGGAPGSTAGGVKMTTVAVLVLSMVSRYKSTKRARVFNRSIPYDTITRAATLMTGAVALIMASTLLLQVTEFWGHPPAAAREWFLDFLFEATSALATTGLSTGVTPTLSTGGRIVIIVLMFIGRVGPLTLAAILLGKSARPRLHYPEEDVMIG